MPGRTLEGSFVPRIFIRIYFATAFTPAASANALLPSRPNLLFSFSSPVPFFFSSPSCSSLPFSRSLRAVDDRHFSIKMESKTIFHKDLFSRNLSRNYLINSLLIEGNFYVLWRSFVYRWSNLGFSLRFTSRISFLKIVLILRHSFATLSTWMHISNFIAYRLTADISADGSRINTKIHTFYARAVLNENVRDLKIRHTVHYSWTVSLQVRNISSIVNKWIIRSLHFNFSYLLSYFYQRVADTGAKNFEIFVHAIGLLCTGCSAGLDDDLSCSQIDKQGRRNYRGRNW